MADYKSNIYPGANYGLDSEYAKDNGFSDFGTGYRFPTSSFALTTDPRTANQLKAVADKLNTGAKTIEITGIQTRVLEAIPDQHLKEINRLKKLTGVDLTLHGPIVEASGIDLQNQKFEETDRFEAERQMQSAVNRGQRLDPDGNVIVVFHSSAALPEMEQKFIKKPGEAPEVSSIIAVDERDGKFTMIKPKENFLLGEKPDPNEELTKMNKERWSQTLGDIGHRLMLANQSIREDREIPGIKNETIMDLYKSQGTEEGQKELATLDPKVREFVESRFNELNHGEVYVRGAYLELQDVFNKAWKAVKNEGDIKRLEEYKKEILNKKNEFEKNGTFNPEKLTELSSEISKGIRVLTTLSETPQMFKPMKDFAMNKSSETFANVAFNAYKKFEDKTPIIAIENPPAGGGFSTAEDLKELVVKSREKFVQKAVEDGMSKSRAEQEAKKLIGATWDVGHINMLRKFGYSDEDLRKQTKTIAPYVKHIHLSDNFGLEHTELPMGMGNVPMKAHLAELQKAHGDKLAKIKKVIEVGDWYQHFQKTPFRETMAAFGSPIYPMQNAPYWNQGINSSAGYFAGYGAMLPEQHFQTYGAGFSSLPQELGGQMGGRSRVSGNPME